VIARHFAGAQQDLVDAVGAIVRARRQNIAAFEVDDLDDAEQFRDYRTAA
jgi:hypothetical protein